MRLLLTSSGIANASIRDALVGLLGKPIEESSALVIPTAIYPFPGGAGHAWQAICGRSESPFAGLGWKSLGVLELSVLPSIDEECWVPAVRAGRRLAVTAERDGLPGGERREHRGSLHLCRDLPRAASRQR